MFTRWLLWRKCDFIFLKLQGSTFPILIVAGSYGKSHYSTESGWVSCQRLLSTSKPVSRHCKMSLLSRWHPRPNLVCIYTKPADSCFIQKKCCWRAKVEGAIDMHLGQIPQRGEWKLNNGTRCSATSYQLRHLFLIASSLTPLSITFIWPYSSFSLFQACLLPTRTLVRTSSPTDASHLWAALQNPQTLKP